MTVSFPVISLSSVAVLLPPSLPLRLEQVEQLGPVLILTVRSSEEEKACRVCGQFSRSVHSRYERSFADLPVQDLRLRFRLRVRRFYGFIGACRDE